MYGFGNLPRVQTQASGLRFPIFTRGFLRSLSRQFLQLKLQLLFHLCLDFRFLLRTQVRQILDLSLIHI